MKRTEQSPSGQIFTAWFVLLTAPFFWLAILHYADGNLDPADMMAITVATVAPVRSGHVLIKRWRSQRATGGDSNTRGV